MRTYFVRFTIVGKTLLWRDDVVPGEACKEGTSDEFTGYADAIKEYLRRGERGSWSAEECMRGKASQQGFGDVSHLLVDNDLDPSRKSCRGQLCSLEPSNDHCWSV
jgi:hypothetical protein